MRTARQRKRRSFIGRLIKGIVIVAVIYVAVAGGLALFGDPGPRETEPRSFADFDALKTLDYSDDPGLSRFTARDGASLAYRVYPGSPDRTLILLHGSGYHGRQLHPMAKLLAATGAATVYVPDIRGHGGSGAPRGDIGHIDQLVEDIEDLIARIKAETPDTRIILGGHSSGGGLAVRAIGAGVVVDRVVLLAPYLGHDAPTTRPNSGGWARPYLTRIIGLSMLNLVGITQLNHLTALDFAMPASVRDGTETLTYSFRLMTGFAPRDYESDLAAARAPILLLIGAKDEAFIPEAYAPAITPGIDATVEIVPELTHLGIAYAPVVAARIAAFLAR